MTLRKFEILREFLLDVLVKYFFFFATGAFLFFIGPDGVFLKGGIQFVWFGFYLAFMLIAISDYGSMLKSMQENKLLVVLIILIISSTTWSIYPSVTLKKSIALAFTTLFGMYVAYKRDITKLEIHLYQVLTILIILSIVVILILPKYGIHNERSHIGIVRGVFHHKNIMARTMTLAAFMYSIFFFRSKKIIHLLLLVISISMVLLSESATGLLSLILTIPTAYFLSRFVIDERKIKISAIVIIIVGLAGIFLLYEYRIQILQLVGKSETLSGRLLIWGPLILSILKNPFLGYGYGSYWDSEKFTYIFQFLKHTEWVTHAHNGYIQTAIDIGLIGLFLFFLILFKRARKIISSFENLKGKYSLFLPCIAFYLILNVTQSFIISQNNIFWFLFVYITCSVNTKHFSIEKK